MTSASVPVDLLRVCWLVPATVIVLYGLPAGAAFAVAAVFPSWRELMILPFLIYTAAAPFVAVLVHFRIHQPARTRVALSFVTGVGSVVVGAVGCIALAPWLGWSP